MPDVCQNTYAQEKPELNGRLRVSILACFPRAKKIEYFFEENSEIQNLDHTSLKAMLGQSYFDDDYRIGYRF